MEVYKFFLVFFELTKYNDSIAEVQYGLYDFEGCKC